MYTIKEKVILIFILSTTNAKQFAITYQGPKYFHSLYDDNSISLLSFKLKLKKIHLQKLLHLA